MTDQKTDFKQIFPTLLPKIKRPFAEKLAETNEVIRHHFEEIEEHGFTRKNMVVAWSGGKDSTLVLWMMRQIEPDIPVMFQNTGVELPETIKFIRRLTREWKINLYETKPYQKNFWQCVEEYGFPKGKSKHGGRSDRCCYYLKERPAMLAIKEHKWEMVFLGTLAAESRQRQFKATMHGTCHHVKSWGCCKVYPILWWTDEEVRAFHKENDIPMNPIYGMGMGRCGCGPCTAYRRWHGDLQKVNPKLYDIVMRKMGQGQLKEWIEMEQ